MLPADPSSPEPRTAVAVTTIVPKPWIPCVLVFLEFVGFVAGHMLWPWFGRGKDPLHEIAYANAATLVLTCILAFCFQRRFSRFRLVDGILALALGVISSLIGIAWGLHDGYGEHL